MKRIVWVGSSRRDLKGFPGDARREAGYQLERLQAGLRPNDWKPLAAAGPGVEEIRIHAGNEYRVLYIARYEEAVYVLHCFAKKTRKTPPREIMIARTRLKQVTAARG
ncbi:MAG: type II toxin-antitoxin system RelE/ParE family toxin [Nitrospinae bacterium]|nr:type II toxin-antitoxin system RelE/ParE family toxin [Nitrospinota bacterium]